MQLKYRDDAPFDTIEVPDLGIAVDRGESFVVDPSKLPKGVTLDGLVGDLCAGDFDPADDEAAALLESLAKPEPVSETPDPPAVPLPDDYPIDGTIAVTMAWVQTADVAERPDRARTAIAIEQAREKPRTSLIEELTQVADTEATA